MNNQLAHATYRICGVIFCTLLIATPGLARAQEGLTFRDGVTTPPVLTHLVQAEYTQQARRAGFHGYCIVRLIVDEHGIPQHVHVSRPIGMGLDESAIQAVKQERFKPATRSGHPVTFPLSMQVNFKPAS